MKILSIRYLVLATLLTLISCNRDKREELFVMPDHVDFSIQPGLNTFDTHFYVISPKPSQLDAVMSATGHTLDEVKSIEAKQAFLSGIFQDVNLNFIDKVSVWIFDPFNPDDKIEFLYLEPIPYRNKTTIQLFPGIADISDWMEQDYFGVEVRLVFREVTPSLIDMRLEWELRALGE